MCIRDRSNPLAIACIIGLTSWMNIAKVVRTEVRQIKPVSYTHLDVYKRQRSSLWTCPAT